MISPGLKEPGEIMPLTSLESCLRRFVETSHGFATRKPTQYGSLSHFTDREQYEDESDFISLAHFPSPKSAHEEIELKATEQALLDAWLPIAKSFVDIPFFENSPLTVHLRPPKSNPHCKFFAGDFQLFKTHHEIERLGYRLDTTIPMMRTLLDLFAKLDLSNLCVWEHPHSFARVKAQSVHQAKFLFDIMRDPYLETTLSFIPVLIADEATMERDYATLKSMVLS